LSVILAIDPGTHVSGWCLYDGSVRDCGVTGNDDLLAYAQMYGRHQADRLALEYIESYGMAVGKEVFATCVWVGRFMQAWSHPDEVLLIPRRAVKLHLCNSPRAKDANIRQAILDKFGGKDKAIGRKAAPGPLYAVKSHAWAALGVALTVAENLALPGALYRVRAA